MISEPDEDSLLKFGTKKVDEDSLDKNKTKSCIFNVYLGLDNFALLFGVNLVPPKMSVLRSMYVCISLTTGNASA